MCVESCGENQWEDTTTHQCKYCSDAGGMMQFCIRCDAANSCQKCYTGYLRKSGDGCVTFCDGQADGGVIKSADNSRCVETCEQDPPNLLTADGYSCVADCWNIGQYYNPETHTCVYGCPPSYFLIFFIMIDYLAMFADSAHKCVSCRLPAGSMLNCYRCGYQGLDLKCTECEKGAYMKSDNSTCVLR